MTLSMELHPLTREDCLLALKGYEDQYGVLSVDRHQPFTDTRGVLQETDDWRAWDAVYSIWIRVFAGAGVLA